MQPSYHNTTNSSGDLLDRYEEKALSQEQRILNWFKVGGRATPSYLCFRLFDNKVPVTSVRRAFTNLTTAGELVKTNSQAKGPYGRPEYKWKLAITQLRLL